MQAVRNPRRGEIGSHMTTGEELIVYKSVAQDAPLRVDLLRKLSQTLPRTNQALFSLTNTGCQRIERCCRFPEDMFGCAELTYRGPSVSIRGVFAFDQALQLWVRNKRAKKPGRIFW